MVVDEDVMRGWGKGMKRARASKKRNNDSRCGSVSKGLYCTSLYSG